MYLVKAISFLGAYSELCKAYKLEHSQKIVNGF